MRTIAGMLRSVKKVDIDEEVRQTFYDTRDQLVDEQQKQIISGLRSDDKPIFNVQTGSDEYSPGYAKKKGKKKPIDLHLTGDFQGNIFIDVRDTEIIIDSADTKSGDLQKKYGGEVFGLNTPHKQAYIDLTKPVFITRIETQLNKR